MSADLFAAFGAENPQERQPPNAKRPSQAAPTFSFFDAPTTASAPAFQTQTQPQPQGSQLTTDAADDWGDFERGSAATTPIKEEAPFAFPSQPQTTRKAIAKSQVWQAPVYKAKTSSSSRVLFDAEDEPVDEEDYFGDFEGPASPIYPPPRPSSTGVGDLLGDLAISQPKGQVSKHRQGDLSFSSVSVSDIATSKGARSKAPSTTPATKNEDWDSFDDWEASIPTKEKPKATTKATSAPKSQVFEFKYSEPSEESTRFDEAEPGELPPTNVPPPGLLLSLFPALFAEADNKLFKPMAAQTLPMRNRLLSEPATVAYLQGYLELASVASRIIAGRKLRWKRDMHLSAGMKIGPASSRGTSGMKLTGIGKSESVKEEREVDDLVRTWKEYVGKLRHVVSAANHAKAGTLGTVPDMQETMALRTLSQAEGGVPARMPCMLCGLKRDERVGDSDTAVLDSFGIWWIDQVNMHRGCRNFWREHRDRLRQR